MALQGNLRDFSATEILQLLGTQKKTGCLMLEWEGGRANVHVLEGRVVSTRTPGLAKDDPLLAFLRDVHRLSEEQLRGILTIQRESGRDLEDLLLNGRYLDAEELALCVERQILDDLMRVAKQESGTYRFDPHTRWNQTPLVRLSIEGVLMEAARRADEQKRYLQAFPDPHQLLAVRDLPKPDEPLTEEERELFGIIDGQHTLAEVIVAAPLSEYETYESLHRMLEAGWIEKGARRAPGVVPAMVVEPARPAFPRRSIARELAVAGVVIACLLGLRLGAHALTTLPPAGDPGRDVFAAERVSDVKVALDLYHRERGRYPETLDALVDDRWLGADQVCMPGYAMVYQVAPGQRSYRLELVADR